MRRFAPLPTFLLACWLLIPSGSLAQRGTLEKPAPVEVWCGGDDGLTSKVCDATEQAFRAAQDFPLRKADETAKYKVVIATNVDWKKVRGRLQILYAIELRNMDDKEIGRFKGSCWESKVQACGTQILGSTRSLLITIVQESTSQ